MSVNDGVGVWWTGAGREQESGHPKPAFQAFEWVARAPGQKPRNLGAGGQRAALSLQASEVLNPNAHHATSTDNPEGPALMVASATMGSRMQLSCESSATPATYLKP